VPTAADTGTTSDGTLAQGAVPPAAPAPARPAATQPVAADPAPAPVENGRGVGAVEIGGILAALGIAGIGIVAMRRRRRDPVSEDAEYETEPMAPRAASEPVPAPAPVMEAALPVAQEAPAYVAPVAAEAPRVVAAPATPRPAFAGETSTTILAAAPLPETAEERQELLDRMVAAEPDEGNPFTSRKGRMRRARIQLQHHEHLAEQAPSAPPTRTDTRFDFRTYRPSTPSGDGQTDGAPAPRKPDFVDA
jgi:hypothetical protein